MYFFLGLLFVAAGAIPLIRTLTKTKELDRTQIVSRLRRDGFILVIDILLLIAVNVAFKYYVQLTWFQSVGYSTRFWTVFVTVIGLFFAGAAITFLLYFPVLRYGFAKVAPAAVTFVPLGIALIAAVIMGVWSAGMWEPYLLVSNMPAGSVFDPVFGQSISFYLFGLPFYAALLGWLGFLVGMLLVLLLLLVIYRVKAGVDSIHQGEAPSRAGVASLRMPLLLSLAAVFVILAVNSYFDIFRLLYSQSGVVTGAGWTDVHVRRWANVASIVLYGGTAMLLVAGAFSATALRRIFAVRMEGSGIVISPKTLIVPGTLIGALILFTAIIPALFQSLVVSPNELALERPYIEHNIDFTRAAYNLGSGSVQERQYKVGRNVTKAVIDANQPTMNNIRLWDWRALRDNLRQQQEIRLYYSFPDVDVDRYTINGNYEQVMLSVRELDKASLAPKSQTWVSRHLIYTHGYGLVMTPVHAFGSEGTPKLLIKDIPPQVNAAGLNVTRPEIYYGELTNDHVYVNTTQKEFDYPSGAKNVYTTYKGKGGVPIGGLVRRFIFGWKYDGYQQIFSDYFTGKSRIMFHRNIEERARIIAPFLRFDQDPYPVLTKAGRVKYIIDAYTTSSRYPYSEIYRGTYGRFGGVNYIRNSVKVVVDAYDGSIDFYVMDPNDIIIKTYRNIFPGLFKPFSDMPEDLKHHIRYPVGLMTVQADVYGTYHMTDVDTFYQREDVWQFATERYRQNFQVVEPYYAMVHFPSAEGGRNDSGVEFSLILPFTPKNKNVMNAWMAGRSDLPDYGKLTVFPIPKGIEVLGPRQIEARIDQNTEMSRALSLWSQRGSQVIRGNMLAIPLFSGQTLYIMFVEPVFLEAEGASLPEIKRIVLADQERVVWSDEFDKSTEALLGRNVQAATVAAVQPSSTQQSTPQAAAANAPSAPGPGTSTGAPGGAGAPAGGAAPGGTGLQGLGLPALATRAAEAFQRYQKGLSQGNYEAAGKALDDLAGIVRRIQQAENGG
ncbi:UPF0182 family membrane protein [Salinispira pacifica]